MPRKPHKMCLIEKERLAQKLGGHRLRYIQKESKAKPSPDAAIQVAEWVCYHTLVLSWSIGLR